MVDRTRARSVAGAVRHGSADASAASRLHLQPVPFGPRSAGRGPRDSRVAMLPNSLPGVLALHEQSSALESVAVNMQQGGYEVLTVRTAEEAIEQVRTGRFGL